MVDGSGWGSGNLIGIETTLSIRRPGGVVGITHFEINILWGGVHDQEVAAFARTVADAAGCSVAVTPTRLATP
jgi:hypothetical protein